MSLGEFTDEWESAYISGGTLWAASADAGPRLRSSNGAQCPRLTKKLAEADGLERFRRSLRYLGLNPSEEPSRPQVRPAVRSAKPRLHTRLRRRARSEQDLMSALGDEGSVGGGEVDCRGLLSKVVYEEWYFAKQREAKSMKEERNRKELEKRLREEDEKRMKEVKCREKYLEWLSKKIKNEEQRLQKIVSVKVDPKPSVTTAKKGVKKSNTKSGIVNSKKCNNRAVQANILDVKNKLETLNIEETPQKDPIENEIGVNIPNVFEKNEVQLDKDISMQAKQEVNRNEVIPVCQNKSGHWKHFWSNFDWLY